MSSMLPPSITVIGSGKAAACPDTVDLTVTISITDKDTALALKRVDTALTGLAEMCTQLGVAERDVVKLAAASIEPHYVSSTFSSSVSLSGWTCERSLCITVRGDAALLARLLDSIPTRTPPGTGFDVAYSVNNVSELRDKSRADAMKECERRASHMAALCKGRVGRLLKAVELEYAKSCLAGLHAFPSDAHANGISVVATYELLPVAADAEAVLYPADRCCADAPTVSFDIVGTSHAVTDVSVLRGTISSGSQQANLTAVQAVQAVQAEQAKVLSLIANMLPPGSISFSTLPVVTRDGQKEFSASMQFCVVSQDKVGPQGKLLGAVAEQLVNVSRGISLEHVISPEVKIDACNASREDAVKEAFHRAETYAAQFGLDIVGVDNLSEAVDSDASNNLGVLRTGRSYHMSGKQQQQQQSFSSLSKQQHIHKQAVTGKELVSLSTSAVFRFRARK